MDTVRNNNGYRRGPVIVLAQLAGLAACIMVLVWCIHYRGGLAFKSSDKQQIFNIHPVLMVIGFVFLSSEAILVYKTVPAKKNRQKLMHLLLLGSAIILGGIGIYAVFKFHKEAKIPDMYSLHSWMGIGTICLYGIQWLVGLVTFMIGVPPKRTRERLHPWHIFYGVFLYALAIATSVVGLLEKLTFQQFGGGLGRFSPEAKLVNFIGVLLVLHGMLVVLPLALR